MSLGTLVHPRVPPSCELSPPGAESFQRPVRGPVTPSPLNAESCLAMPRPARASQVTGDRFDASASSATAYRASGTSAWREPETAGPGNVEELLAAMGLASSRADADGVELGSGPVAQPYPGTEESYAIGQPVPEYGNPDGQEHHSIGQPVPEWSGGAPRPENSSSSGPRRAATRY